MATTISYFIKNSKWIILLSLAVTIGFAACFSEEEKSDVKNHSPFRNVYGDAEYVGTDACKNCHAQQHSTFIHTGMGQSFESASMSKSSANFNNALVFDSLNDMYYQAFWVNEKMFIKEFQLQGNDTIHSRTEEISHIIGSGHHTNSHFWMENGFLYQAPMTWYVQEKKWGLPPGYETNNIGFSRKIGYECMSCHNSLPKIKNGSVNKYIDIPNGIGCERCHGPGSIHVEEKSKGILVDTKKEADYSIVNPKRLPWKLQIDICQRCHLQGNALLKEGKTFEDFRPGMPLSDVMQVYLPVYDNPNHPFVMASHAERFQMSKCFTQSNSDSIESYNPNLNFTCINCHNPHVSVRATNIERFNSTCTDCHGKKEELKLCTANESEILAQDNNCVSCHMPASGSEDIPHVSIHDHYIRKPGDKMNTKGKVVGLKSINGGDTSEIQQLMAYLTYFEKFDQNQFYISKASDLAEKTGVEHYSKQAVHYWYNLQNYKKVVGISRSLESSKVKNAFTAYQIGQSHYNELDYSQALIWYNRSIELMPLQLDYRIAKVQVLLELSRIEQAKTELDYLFGQQQKLPEVWYLKGIYLTQKGELYKAKLAFQKVLSLDPRHVKAQNQLRAVSQ